MYCSSFYDIVDWKLTSTFKFMFCWILMADVINRKLCGIGYEQILLSYTVENGCYATMMTKIILLGCEFCLSLVDFPRNLAPNFLSDRYQLTSQWYSLFLVKFKHKHRLTSVSMKLKGFSYNFLITYLELFERERRIFVLQKGNDEFFFCWGCCVDFFRSYALIYGWNICK